MSQACPSPLPLFQVIRGLERERDRFAGEAAAVGAKLAAATQEVALRDAAIQDLNRKMTGGGRVGPAVVAVTLPACPAKTRSALATHQD